MMFFLAGIALLVLALVAVAASKPDEMSVTRKGLIPAAPDAVFAHINDLHKWEAWSPWAKLDPNSKSEFSGPAEGTGASMKWDGNSKVGSGSMTITASQPSTRIEMKLEFIRPFKGLSTVLFTLAPEAGQTLVTWNMTGRNNLMAKVMGLFINCDKMIGDQYEKGLESLKAVVKP